jgi:hypothetical protein
LRIGRTRDPLDLAYERIRLSRTDVRAIARATGYKVQNIRKIKQHLFVKRHLLDRYVEQGIPAQHARFDPYLPIAEAWDRLALGTFTPADLQLLRHEIAEAWYMRNVAPGWSAAHNRVQSRYPAPEL